MKLIKKKH